MSLAAGGIVRYPLKKGYRDGNTHVIVERGCAPSLYFITWLATLAPPAAYAAVGHLAGNDRYRGTAAI